MVSFEKFFVVVFVCVVGKVFKLTYMYIYPYTIYTYIFGEVIMKKLL